MSTRLLKTGPKEAQRGRLSTSGSSPPAMCEADFNTCWKYAHAPCAGAFHPTASPPHRPDGNLAHLRCDAHTAIRQSDRLPCTSRHHQQKSRTAPAAPTCSANANLFKIVCHASGVKSCTSSISGRVPQCHARPHSTLRSSLIRP